MLTSDPEILHPGQCHTNMPNRPGQHMSEQLFDDAGPLMTEGTVVPPQIKKKKNTGPSTTHPWCIQCTETLLSQVHQIIHECIERNRNMRRKYQIGKLWVSIHSSLTNQLGL